MLIQTQAIKYTFLCFLWQYEYKMMRKSLNNVMETTCLTTYYFIVLENKMSMNDEKKQERTKHGVAERSKYLLYWIPFQKA